MEGYKHLASYILATVIYDLTMEFCKIFIRPGSRTRDQMEQVFDSEGRALRLRLEEMHSSVGMTPTELFVHTLIN